MASSTDLVVGLALILGSYLVGTFPTAQLVGRRFGFDPTASGSGNPGASNTTRLGGARAGALVFTGDAGKGAVAAIAGLLVGGSVVGWFAGAAAVAGHLWPVTRSLRGGKGVATVAGVGVVCAPLGFAFLAVVFAAAVKISGHAAVGSLAATVLMPVVLGVLGRPGAEVAVAAAVAAAIVVRHRDNIERLRRGSGSTVGSG